MVMIYLYREIPEVGIERVDIEAEERCATYDIGGQHAKKCEIGKLTSTGKLFMLEPDDEKAKQMFLEWYDRAIEIKKHTLKIFENGRETVLNNPIKIVRVEK